MADRRFRLAGRRIDALYQWAEENGIDLAAPLGDAERALAQNMLDRWKAEDYQLLADLRAQRDQAV